MKALLVLLSLNIAGCGISRVAEQTLKQVEDSNTKQEQLLYYMEQTKVLSEQIKDYNKSIDKYNEQIAHGIHLQILSTALDGMFATENTEVLLPPLAMMPYAQTYAEEAYPEELSKTLDYLLKRVYLTPHSHQKVRAVSLTAMGLLASFAPASVFHEVVEVQVDLKGVYEEMGYVAGVLRFHFTRDFLLKPIYESSDVQNKATLSLAVHYFRNMKKLTELKNVKDYVFDYPAMGVENWTIDREELSVIGQRAARVFVQKLSESTLQIQEVGELLSEFDID